MHRSSLYLLCLMDQRRCCFGEQSPHSLFVCSNFFYSLSRPVCLCIPLFHRLSVRRSQIEDGTKSINCGRFVVESIARVFSFPPDRFHPKPALTKRSFWRHTYFVWMFRNWLTFIIPQIKTNSRVHSCHVPAPNTYRIL